MGGERNMGFIKMIFATIIIVLFASAFATILAAFATIWTTTGLSNFIGMEIATRIGPTLLYIMVILGAGALYASGYKQVSSADPNGVIRMMFGILEIILFLSLFSTILTNLAAVYATANTTWIALQIVVSISAVVLFLSGLFAGGATAYGGYKARKSARGAMVA
jgi:hypothetical protein